MYTTRVFSSRVGAYAPACTALWRAQQLTRSPTATAAAIYWARSNSRSLHTSLPRDTKNTPSNEDPPPSREDDTIASHEEFVERFSKILETIKEKPLEPVKVDEEWAATDKELTDALAEMFAKVKVEVTPELLERRQKLREKYPEILGSITDEELDS